MSFTLAAGALAAVLAGSTAGRPQLPEPSGQYAVGTRLLEPLVDGSRPDTRFVSGKRTVAVQLWYPAAPGRGGFSPYIPEPWLVDYLKREGSSPEDIESWRHLSTHGRLGAPAASGVFPLVLFSQGMGMSRFNYTAWVEDLASRGFIVASIDHPEIAPLSVDGRIVASGAPDPDPAVPARRVGEMAADIELVRTVLLRSADRLHIDKENTAVVGHSLGGAAALETCRTNPSVGACVDIDGDAWGRVEQEGVGRAFLLLLNEPTFSDADFTARGRSRDRFAEMGRQRRAQWKELATKQSAPAVLVLIRGTNHLSFTDAPFVRPSLVAESGGALTDPVRVLRTTVRLIAQYLKNSFAGNPTLVAPGEAFVTVTPLKDW